MATVQENITSLTSAFSTHMKNKNPGVDAATIANIDDFATAYATAIANAIGAYSDGDGEVVLTDYIKKIGGADGVMSGKFTATSEFVAGYDHAIQLSTSITGVSIFADVNQSSGVFKGHGFEMFRHEDTWLKINSLGEFTDGVNVGGPLLKTGTAFLVGVDAASGFFASASELKYKGASIYHSINANNASIDWTTKNLSANGNFAVTGEANIGSTLTAINGFQLGHGGVVGMGSSADGIDFFVPKVYLAAGSGLYSRFNDDYILNDHNNGAVTLSAAGTELHIGYHNTTKNILSASLYTYNGDKLIIDKFGAGTFNWGFQAGTEGETKFYTHDLGSAISGLLYINNSSTIVSEGEGDAVRMSTPYGYIDIGAIDETYLSFKTNKSSFYFDKAVMGSVKVGILNSTTRIEANKLLLSDSSYFFNVSDGIKHYGHSYITGNIGTESYASGFSGYGWRITPEAAATFTDLTIRRKLKVYELEVQKITAVNGSFWVSSNCSGETVTAL